MYLEDYDMGKRKVRGGSEAVSFVVVCGRGERLDWVGREAEMYLLELRVCVGRNSWRLSGRVCALKVINDLLKSRDL